MTMDIALVLGVSLGVTLVCMVGLWVLSLRNGDPSFVDAWWPTGFVVVAWTSFGLSDGDPARKLALAGVTTVWGARLGLYLLRRWRRNGPDKRYVNMIRKAGGRVGRFTLVHVFLTQGVLLWAVSLPLQLGQIYAEPHGLRAASFAGIALAALGIAFEWTGDEQLRRFKADASNAGKTMDRGLWRFTRHPNYFGDACTWWGLFLISVVNPVTAVAALSPALMTFLLAKWSGVGPLERRMLRHKPDYEAYIARTSGFIPLPPRRRALDRSTP